MARYVLILEQYRLSGNRLGEAHTLRRMGGLQRSVHPDLAHDLLVQALGIYRQLGDELNVAMAINEYGWGFARGQQPQRAVPYLLQAADLFDQLGIKNLAAENRQEVERIQPSGLRSRLKAWLHQVAEKVALR